jgi:prepilin-type N-terminal cleavage/methylation domain-containing protein|tara:strand:+ start:558 stop:1109 length:552 start_codon:yes stop_codon:yes gene_type:complete
MTAKKPGSLSAKAFSLVELLLVLAIISIMAALVINSFSNAAQDSRNVMARQQQATLQSAINNWISGQVGGFESPDPSNPSRRYERTVGYVRNKYNYASNYWTESPSHPRGSRSNQGVIGRLELIKDYLDDGTYSHLADSSPTSNFNRIQSSAMAKTGQYIELSAWSSPAAEKRTPYPKVELYP